jgi:hypothetical protein
VRRAAPAADWQVYKYLLPHKRKRPGATQRRLTPALQAVQDASMVCGAGGGGFPRDLKDGGVCRTCQASPPPSSGAGGVSRALSLWSAASADGQQVDDPVAAALLREYEL